MPMRFMDDQVKDKILFMKKFVSNPRTIGSIAPSSPFLAESIFSNIDWSKIGFVAELGAGTGVFTKKIIKKMGDGKKLLVFEIEPELRRRLQMQTDLTIYPDATELPQVLADRGISNVDLIISSLPYAVLPRKTTQRVLDGIVRSLNPEGVFLAFQYSLHMKEPFEKIFDIVKTRFVPLNIPPAFVYECTWQYGNKKNKKIL